MPPCGLSGTDGAYCDSTAESSSWHWAEEQCCVLYWFDCMGQPPNLFKGNFEGDVLTLVSDECTEGGPRFSRLVYDLTVPGELKSKMEVSQDGESWELFMEAGYTRE